MSIKINQPHDSFVRRSLTNLEVAKDILKPRIPADICERINWNTLQVTNKSFTKKELVQLHSDIIYQCQLNDKEAYIYLLLEHQSTPDKLLPFRMLSYNVALMEQHLEQIEKKLPIIINLCLYAGKESPYPYSGDIYDCFAEPDLAKREIFKPLRLIDLSVLSQEELLEDGTADLLEIILKEGIKRDFLKWIKENKQIVARLFNRFYVESALIYILEVDDKNDSQELIQAMIEAAPNQKEIIMTAAQQLRQTGIQEGIQTGLIKGIKEGIQSRNLDIATNMLKEGLEISLIQKVTGLTREAIEKLTKE
jgi:predicted transposase/invertase (TIGR01784 family)